MRVAVAGAGGRMGRALVQAVTDTDGLTLAAATEHGESAFLGNDAGELAGCGRLEVAITTTIPAAANCEVLIDFTRPEATVANVRDCLAQGRRLVIGTTGMDADQRADIEAAAASIPIVWAPNMSTGVNLSLRLIELAARALGDEVDVEIIEAHHRYKQDAPSGTALRMGQVVADALGRDLNDCAVYGRQGRGEPRDRQAIGFETIRAGDIVGEHTVMFADLGERVEISHRATSRMTFARGAMRAARWLVNQPPGLYDMQDVLGLRA